MSRPRHPKKEVEEAIQYAERRGWHVRMGGAHAWGFLYCPFAGREGCIVPVWSTPTDAGNHAKRIKRRVNKCQH